MGLIKINLEKATRASTPDNVQPFVFHLFENHLIVEIDVKRSKHFLNPQEKSSLVTFGFWLEYLNQYCAPHGFQYELENGENFPIRLKKVSLTQNIGIMFDEQILSTRRCYRGQFSHTELGLSEIASIRVAMGKVHAQIIWKGSDDFVKLSNLLIKIDSILFEYEELFKDTLHWVRFSWKKYLSKKDGFYYSEMGVNYFEACILFIFYCFPWALRFFLPLTAWVSRQKLKKNLASSLGYVLVGSDDLIGLGRQGARVWLMSNQIGMGFQPFSIASFVSNLYLEQNHSLAEYIKKNKINETLKSVSKVNSKYLWLFRFGKLPDSIGPLSLRRPPQIIENK